MTGSSTPDLDPDEQMVAALSDEALAIEFATTYRDELRFVGAWGKWFHWTGSVWRQDDTLTHFDLARKITRRIANQLPAGLSAAQSLSEPKRIASAKTVAAVLALARADRRLSATADQWDQNDWLLNTPDGVVDLKTGEMREHRPEDFMTKMTAVSPGGECPLWLKFLDQVMAGDPEKIAYLQRVAGYALTGSTKEHALFFLYGGGANGKGTFVETFSKIMADYHVKSSIDTFTEQQTAQHSTNVAGLAGARLITVSETQGGRKWDEGKVKELTGGDAMRARKMRQDEFTFQPKGKLVISGNYKPGLRTVDEAIRRRFNLVEFGVKIEKKDRDVDLPEKLVAEWPGILKWAIEGCLEWQRIGLAPPVSVLASTDEYLDAEDAVSRWIADCCTVDVDATEKSGALWASWVEWAKFYREAGGTHRTFSQALGAKGFERGKGGERRFKGIKIREDQEPM